MKIKQLTEKYSLNYDDFIEFILETELNKKPELVKLKLFGQAEILDDFVTECVAIYKADRGVQKDNYFLTLDQQDEIAALVGKEVTSRLSDKQLEEFDKLYDLDKSREFLEKNLPNYTEIVCNIKFDYIRELEKNKLEGLR